MDGAAQLSAAVRRLTEALAAQPSPHEWSQLVVDEALRLTGADTAVLCMLTEPSDQLDFVAVAGADARQVVGLRIRVADSLSEGSIKTAEPMLLDSRGNAETGDLFSTEVQSRHDSFGEPPADGSASGPHRRSAAVAPIVVAGRPVGTLLVQSDSGGPSSAQLGQTDIETLVSLASIVALEIQTTRATSRVSDMTRELAVLYDAAHSVSGNLNVQQVMENALGALCTHIEFQTASLFLLNDERTHLFVAAERGLTEEEREIQLAVDIGPHAACLASGEAAMSAASDAVDADHDAGERAVARSTIIAPIKSRNEIQGLLQITSPQRDAYTETDLRLASTIGVQAGIAIENAWQYEAAQRQSEQATALYDLSQHVNATLNIDNVLEFVAESVINLLNVDRFALLLVDEKSQRLVPRLSRFIDETDFGRYHPAIGEGIPGWVYEWQTPQAVANIAADPRDRTASLERFGVASVLCVPMHVGDNVIGIVMGMTSRRRLFTVGEMELLYTIANQAAVAAYNALQYRLARTRSHEMSRYLRRIAGAMGSSFVSNLPQVVADLAVEIVRAERCAIYAVDGDRLVLRATSRFRASAPAEAEIRVGDGLTGLVARRGQSIVAPNVLDDPRSRAHGPPQRDQLASYCGVPLKAGRRTVGVIDIYSQPPRQFTQEEIQLLTTFAKRSRLAERLVEGAKSVSAPAAEG